MKLTSKLKMSVSKRPGNVVLRRELSGLGAQSQLSEAIKSLISSGHLVRLSAGVYAKSGPLPDGSVRLAAPPELIEEELRSKLGVSAQITQVGAHERRSLFMLHTTARHSSKLKNSVPFSGIDRRREARIGTFTLPESVDLLPKKHVREFVERLATAHGVQYQRTGLDDFAEAVTRLAGDDSALDETGKLLATLRKKTVITGRQLARLMTNHMMEQRDDVRPVRGLQQRRVSPQR